MALRPKKSLSQNFLIDPNIACKLCDLAEVQKGETVLEIGPGLGAITKKLLERGAKVIAIEKDSHLAALLKQWKCDNLQVHTEDALAFSLGNIQGPVKVISNLPYHTTTPFLLKYASSSPTLSSLTIFIQMEVAQKLLRKSNEEMGFLFLFLNAYSSISYGFPVSASCFFPRPTVKSAALTFKLHPFCFPFDPKPFFEFMQLAFGKKRKMLRSSLKEKYHRIDLNLAAKKIGLSLDRRPGTLSLEEFASLFQELNK